MTAAAKEFIPMSGYAKGQWWDERWKKEPYAVTLWKASTGIVDGCEGEKKEIGEALQAAATKIKRRKTLSRDWIAERQKRYREMGNESVGGSSTTRTRRTKPQGERRWLSLDGL